jgi:hypothetical protein
MLRMLPGAGWFAARFARPPPPPPPLPLLDQVSATLLSRTAPGDLGLMSRAGLLRSRGRRLADLGSWVALVAVALGAMLFIAAGSAFGAWSAFWQGGFGIGSMLQIAFLLLAGFGVLMVSKLGLGGLGQRRLRRRKRLLKRMLRYLLRLFDSGRRWAADAAGVAGRGAATGHMRHPASLLDRLSRLSPQQFGRAFLLTAAVAGLAFYPLFADEGSAAGSSGGASGLQLNAGGPGSTGDPGSQPQTGPPTPTSTPTPDSDDDVAGAQATGAADDEEEEEQEQEAAPTPTLTPIPPTATFTPIPPTATFTPIPCVADLSEDALDFGDDLTSLPLTLSLNDCGGPVTFLTGGSDDWIEVNPTGGTLQPGGTANLTVLIDRDSLSPGTYSEEVEIATAIGNFDIPIFVEVEPPPCEVQVSPRSLDFGSVNQPETLEFEISLNDCGEDIGFDVSVSRGGAGWIFVDPLRGILTPGSSVDIEVSVDPGPMQAGPNSATLTIETDAGDSSVTVTACRPIPGGPPCGR